MPAAERGSMLLFRLTLLLCISCSLPGPLHGRFFYGSSQQITAPPQKNSGKTGTSIWNRLAPVSNRISALRPSSIFPLPFSLWGSANKAGDTTTASTLEVSTRYSSTVTLTLAPQNTSTPNLSTPHILPPRQTGALTPTPRNTEPSSFPAYYSGRHKRPENTTRYYSRHEPIHTSTTPGSEERSDWTHTPSYLPTQTASLQETAHSLPVQGTMSYLTGTKSPPTLRRTRPPTVEKKPVLDPRADLNFDLDLWPQSKGPQREVLQRASDTKSTTSPENWTTTEVTTDAGGGDPGTTPAPQSRPTRNFKFGSWSSWTSLQTHLPTPTAQAAPQTPASTSTSTRSPATQASPTPPTLPAATMTQRYEDAASTESERRSQEERPGRRPPEGTRVTPGPTPTPWLAPRGPGAGDISETENQGSDIMVTMEPTQKAEPGKELRSPDTTAHLPNAEDTPSWTEDWRTGPAASDISLLPDCNMERSGICNTTDNWAPMFPTHKAPANTTTSGHNQSSNAVLVPASPMLVALHSDWNSAMATWGLAWEAHIYGVGVVFCLVALASALNLLCLPLRCPSGCGYFALVSVFLLAAGSTRAFALLYDAYGHQDRLGSTAASLLLYEAPFPCLTAAFGLVFLLLSMRSRMQLSYSAFQRPCFLACLVLLHFTAAFGPVALLSADQQGAPVCLFLSLVSRGAFVALASFLSAAYFVFYCYVRADSKHIYHLNNTSPTPAERYNRCPFAESREWDRAAAAVFLSAVLSLVCAGLQVYGMLHALGFAGGPEVFKPWPWWSYQLSCRVCEAGVCLALALVVAQPLYCSDHLPQPGNCWTELLAAKSPILPGSYQWTLNQQEKLAICDTIGHGETECLPLYSLVDERLGSSLNGLDLLYHSNRALAYRDFDLDPPDAIADTRESSCGSDSSTDLRPPSPINLRRSIDEALFSEDLFPMSLFSPLRPFSCSDRALEPRDNLVAQSSCTLPLRESLPSDPALLRTSSCMEIPPQASLPHCDHKEALPLGLPPSPATSSRSSSPEGWRGSSSTSSLYRPSLAGSSLVLCSSPEVNHRPSSLTSSSAHTLPLDHQRQYRNLDLVSQESPGQPSELDQSVQDEFISVCRQIDALSVCSETIDL